MNSVLYEILALAFRYVFIALGIIIVARAWRLTIVDNRRANRVRSWASETGQLGELVVLKGSGKAKKGMRYPIILEGMLGSSSQADIRIRSSSVARKHAYFKVQNDGMLFQLLGNAQMKFANGKSGEQLLAVDGDRLTIGNIELLLVLFDGQTNVVHSKTGAAPQPGSEDEMWWDDEMPKRMPRTTRPAPASRPENPQKTARKRSAPLNDNDLFLMGEDQWQDKKPTRRPSKKR